MDIERRQADLVEHFVKQASANKGSSLVPIIINATSKPSLFAFFEILAVPNVVELEGAEHSMYLSLLRLFAHGTWGDYKILGMLGEVESQVLMEMGSSCKWRSFTIVRLIPITSSYINNYTPPNTTNAGSLPELVPDQVLKLKQLTVLTLAETSKVLLYDQLMEQLDVTNVRELEDFLINECMYAGIVRGKLDQWRRCFEVQFAAGRDLRPGQLGSMIQTLADWLSTSDNLLLAIQEKIKWADTMSEADKKHKKEVEDRMEDLKKSLSHKDMDFRGQIFSEPGRVMDFEEERVRPKRRRHPLH